MLTFPVDLEEWLAPFRVVSQTFDLGEGLQVQNRTAGGEILRSGGAARLWRGSLVLAPIQNEAAAGFEARAQVLRAAGASILIRDYRRSGTFAAQVRAVNSTTRDIITLQAAPPGRVISAGDYLAFDYSGRRALHQVVVGKTVDASGNTGNIEVVPPFRTLPGVGWGLTIGAAKCRAVIVPGSLSIGIAADGATDSISFDWTQTLRENP